MKKVEVCFTPHQFELYFTGQEIVVVIDVLRATTAICAAIANGVEGIIPVASIEEALAYQKKGYLVGAERNGEVVDGFDFGNSPYSYMGKDLKGKTLVLSTTNGTQAIAIAKEASQIVIGSLINLDAVCKYLIAENKNVLLLCSGWKNKFNLEDTICAGAIANALIDTKNFTSEEDATVSARFLFKSASANYFSFLRASSHRQRLRKLNLNKDIIYSLKPNQVDVVPILYDGVLQNCRKEISLEDAL